MLLYRQFFLLLDGHGANKQWSRNNSTVQKITTLLLIIEYLVVDIVVYNNSTALAWHFALNRITQLI